MQILKLEWSLIFPIVIKILNIYVIFKKRFKRMLKKQKEPWSMGKYRAPGPWCSCMKSHELERMQPAPQLCNIGMHQKKNKTYPSNRRRKQMLFGELWDMIHWVLYNWLFTKISRVEACYNFLTMGAEALCCAENSQHSKFYIIYHFFLFIIHLNIINYDH